MDKRHWKAHHGTLLQKIFLAISTGGISVLFPDPLEKEEMSKLVRTAIQEKAEGLLREKGSQTPEGIVKTLMAQEFSEQEAKGAIWNLLDHGRIILNRDSEFILNPLT